MTDLALVEGGPTQLDVTYWGGVLVFAAQVADAVSDTEFVPGALRGRREAVAATILYGAEVGLTPMQSLAGIHIVDGRPAPSAELCRAMILRAGHTFHVAEMTGTRARVWGQRKGRPDAERVVVEWTTDMARAAGLLGRQAWQRYPRAMLVARATGDLARILFPDVVKGLGYIAEDESAELDTWAPAVDEYLATPTRKPLQRRRRTPTTTPVVEGPGLPPGPLAGESAPVAPDDGLDHSRDMLDADRTIPDDERAAIAADLDAAEKRTADRWLTDEEAEAAQRDIADAARAAVEESLDRQAFGVHDDDEMPPSVPGPYPSGHLPGDVPLPEDLRPVGTGRPIPRAVPVPTSPDNEPTPAPVMPEPEPEQPDDEGATGPPLMGVRPFKALQAGLSKELGTAATDDERHALVAAIVGHPVESTKKLTRADGYLALSYLGLDGRFADGTASWEFTDGGASIRVLDNREPPPQEG